MSTERRITRQTERILETLMSDPAAQWWGSRIAPAAGLKSGTLYPALLRMERFGWLTWQWEDIDPTLEKRPRRRLYRLTGAGELAARQIAAQAQARERMRAHRTSWSPKPQGLLPT
jgi:PadR family transcriptional regulator, regulatory protein PadR